MWKIDKGTDTGTTTNSYADALAWNTAELGKKTILLKNTHGSNGLKYKLIGHVVDSGIADELVSETTLVAGETAEFHYDIQWHKLVLQIKAAVDNNQADYQVDYEGQGA